MDIRNRLLKIYENEELVNEFLRILEKKLNGYLPVASNRKGLSQKDAILITYGDSVVGDEKETGNLKYLNKLLNKYVGDRLSAVHILPMFPYSSDDGFSVIDYKEIGDHVGSWHDVKQLKEDYDLMFDGVINHISQESEWFKKCLAGDEKYKNYFIEKVGDGDYSKVVRPRTSPLFSVYESKEGKKEYWTTFSADQVDLNYENPDTVTDIIELLLYYAGNGAKFIRLDAIGFMWKEVGTSCLHHEKTHEMIKLMRDILDEYAPETMLITETNVPHKENISYFGNGYDEAQLVYQFPLPPLTLFSFLSEDASKLSKWADSLETLSDTSTYFNFLASHDGIGLRPTEGLLTNEERLFMANRVLKSGGRINYKRDPDGGKSPYELNVNYQDALTSPYDTDSNRINRFVASQVLLMSVVGVPAIYIHSLFGSRNDYYGVETSGINRRINREKLEYGQLCDQLNHEGFRSEILSKLLMVLEIRKKETAFDPKAIQEVLKLDPKVFAIRRHNLETKSEVFALINVSCEKLILELDVNGRDLISNEEITKKLVLRPLQYRWIKSETKRVK